MNKSAMSYVYGPVPSRRLGRSLGVDLVPFKTCTYDCVYCQLGRTTRQTLERCCFVDPAIIFAEIEKALQTGPPPDFITLAGSGEPTLYQPLDQIIAGIKARAAAPVAVLTNGSLLGQPEVQAELQQADLVIPSLDAGNEVFFRLVNRPHPGICFANMLAGLIQFRRAYTGPIWLEVFLLGGLTTRAEHIEELSRLLPLLAPERVQLNTVARPSAEAWAQPASQTELQHAAALFGPSCEIIADTLPPEVHESRGEALQAAILSLLQRRPCRLADIACGLGLHRQMAQKCLQPLLESGAVVAEKIGSDVFYKLPAAQ